MITEICNQIYKGEHLRENLIELNRQIREDEALDLFLDEYYENEPTFIHLLDDTDPKVRKNVIKLMAKVADQVLMDTLYDHYEKDDTQFLKAEYLTAFEAFDYTKYLPRLKERRFVLESKEKTKHVLDELKHIKRLIWKIEPPKRHTFSGYDLENHLLFIVPRGFEPIFMGQLNGMADTTAKSITGGCLVQTKHLLEISKLRTYQAVLFDAFPKLLIPADGCQIGEALLKHGLIDYLKARHSEKAPFFFRTEIKGINDIRLKNKLSADLSHYLEENSEGMLENEPSFYEIEVRVITGKNGCRIFLKFMCMTDDRFKYRKYVTASSMQPSRAAMILNEAKDYLRKDANVLDPFCGTGTLLIERAKLMESRSLYGLDISAPAIQAAWENSQRADVIINLIQRNFNDFRHEYKFDEVITDFPRKSENRFQAQIESLYYMFFEQCQRIVADQGILVLYTEENRLIDRILKTRDEFEQIDKHSIGKSDTSWIYVIKKIK